MKMRHYALILTAILVLVLCESESGQRNQPDHKDESNDADESNGALVMVESDDDDDDEDVTGLDFSKEATNMFKPTNDWQKVEQGQAIPRGLHVRLNVQTGEREAKLLDSQDTSQKTTDSSEKSRLMRMKSAMQDAMKDLEPGKETAKNYDLPDDLKYWKHADKEGMMNMKNTYFTRQELKEALKKFKVSHDDVQHSNDHPSGTSNKFRTIEEIREDFKTLNMDVKSDLELLTETLSRYRVPDVGHDERLNVLTDLEYYLHQIDNAKNFADMGGLQLVIADLNSTFEDIRSEAALVLGSAVQSNPSVQISAVEAGALQQLIRLLSTEPSPSCRNRLLVALSSLIRHFPFAQRKFVELGGLQSLTDVLAKSGDGIGYEKLSVKAITLVADLLTERLTVESDKSSVDALHGERLQQYSQVHILQSVIEHGWCHLVPKLLQLPEHDAREKVLGIMWLLRDSCRDHFVQHLSLLKALRQEYSTLSADEIHDADGGDEIMYFSGLLQRVDHVIGDVLSSRDEL